MVEYLVLQRIAFIHPNIVNHQVVLIVNNLRSLDYDNLNAFVILVLIVVEGHQLMYFIQKTGTLTDQEQRFHTSIGVDPTENLEELLSVSFVEQEHLF